MKRCAACGGQLGEFPVALRYRGRDSVFCSFACAIAQAAPACSTCGAKILGRGQKGTAGAIYCTQGCALRAAG